jgi:AcrR family transcriptional regulator
MPVTESRLATRDAILEATDRLLARFGYRKMSMDDLAREARIGRRTIYLHFQSKEEVALASIDRVVERLVGALIAIARGADPADARLRAMLRTRVLFRFDSVRGYYQSLDDLFAALRPAYMARRDRYFEAEARLFAEVLEEGRRAGLFAFDEAIATGHTLLLATNSLLPYSLTARELGERRDVEAKVTRIADLLVGGLRPSQERRTRE